MLASILFAGCATKVSNSQIDESRVRQVALVAELAAYNGTKIYLIDHPDKRKVFENVHANLNTLLAEDQIALDKFLTIVRTLPIKELQSEKGQLIVDNAVILFTAYSQDVIKLDQLEQVKKLKPLVESVKNGIEKALK